MNSWLDDTLESLLRIIGAFFTGKPVLGPATSDATFWRRGHQTTRRSWPANSWSLRPHWQKLAARLAVIVAVVAVWRWQWIAVTGLAVLVVAELGYLLVRKPWRDIDTDVATGFDPQPLFDGLRPILGISEQDTWHDWIGVASDIDQPDRTAPIYLRLPENWTQQDPRHGHVAQVVTHHLPGEWTPVWYLEGYVEFHPLPEQYSSIPLQAATPDGAAQQGQSHALTSYAPPEIDPLFAAQQPIVIDGEQAQHAPRRSR